MRKFLLSFFLLSTAAFAQSNPGVSVGASIGVTGSQSLTGQTTLSSMTDANYTMLPSEWWAGTLIIPASVTLTAQRDIIAPANPGQSYCIENKSTGSQSARIIAATGTGVVVSNSATGMTCATYDGTNYVAAGGSLSAITALTGDGTATGPGSAVLTLATVNGSPGSCGDATHVCQVTTNGKGLTTAQSAVAVTASTPTTVNINAVSGQPIVDSITSSLYNGLTCFGDSYMVVQSPNACQTVGLDNQVPSGAVVNNAVSGDNSLDFANRVFTSYNPGDANNPTVIGSTSINNLGFGSGSPALQIFNQTTYGGVTWAALSSTQKILAGNAAVTPSGSTAADTTFPNANGVACTSGTCTLSMSTTNFTVGTPGVFFVWYIINSTGGNISTTSDAATVTDAVTGLTTVNTAWGSFPPANTSVSAGVALYPASAASHTVVVTFTAGATILGFGFPPTIRNHGVSGPNFFLGGTAFKPGSLSGSVTALNNATIAIAKTLSGYGLRVPFVDMTDAYNYSQIASTGQECDFNFGSSIQLCPLAASSAHPNAPGVRHAAAMWESAINTPAATVSAAAGQPTTMNGPWISQNTPAATSANGFFQMTPHNFNDTLIAGTQQCNGALCGTKQYKGAARGVLGFGLYNNQIGSGGSNEIGLGWATTSAFTAETQFVWPIWGTYNNTTDLGTWNSWGSNVSGGEATVAGGTATTPSFQASNNVASTASGGFFQLLPHNFNDTLIAGTQQCKGELCGTKQIRTSRSTFGFANYINMTGQELDQCWATTTAFTLDSQFACPIWGTFDNSADFGTWHEWAVNASGGASSITGGTASSPALTVINSVAATSASGFFTQLPNSSADTLIAGTQQCRGGPTCGTKQIRTSRSTFGYAMYINQLTQELDDCWATTAAFTADTNFACPIWRTYNNTTDLGTIHAWGLNFGGTTITGASAAQSQVVTCPTGGTGTQYCGADGAWHTAAGGTVTTTGTPATTYLAGFSGSASITGTNQATIDGSGRIVASSFSNSTLATEVIPICQAGGVQTVVGCIPTAQGVFIARAQTAAITTTTIGTSSATSALYRLNASVTCDTTVAAATVTMTISWTDTSGTAQTLQPSSAICTSLGGSSYSSIPSTAVNILGSTNITIQTSIGGSPNYDIAATVERLTVN